VHNICVAGCLFLFYNKKQNNLKYKTMTNNSEENSGSSSEAEGLGVKFIDPLAVIAQMNLKQGEAIADFGCGTGYFSIPLAQKIGEEGKVYSLDVVPEKLEAVESQAKTLGLTNLVIQRVNLENKEGSKLKAESVDWVIMKDVLFQNKEKNNMLEEAKRVLKPGGKVLLVEWKTEDTAIGPDQEIRISKEKALELINKCELGIEKEIAAGDFHYGYILTK